MSAPSPTSTSRLPGVTAAALAGAAFALAGHLGLLRAFGTVLPYRDQWQCTAVEIIEPWINGTLGWKTFFTPLNDHWPVLTRLLSFLLLRLNGQWNNLLETTVNALLFATAIFFFLRRVLPGLRGWARPAFAALTGLLAALPITWENTLWGIQSLVYSQILFTLFYLDAVVTESARFSRRWWLGLAAGVLVLFTQHSAILAHIAAAILLGWRVYRSDGDRRVALAGLAFAGIVLVSFAAFFPSITVTAALRADSWPLALHVFLQQLAWPMRHPAWALLLYAPWLLWCVRTLAARRLAPTDAFLLVLGLWVGAQAAAIGYGRGGETFTFASRYCDFLALGLLLNAAALARLWLGTPRLLARVAFLALGLVWLVAPLKSFWWEISESHAGFNLSHRSDENQRNLERLRTTFATHDSAALLADAGTAQELFTYPPAVARLIADPRFAALLPPETNAPGARSDHGRLGWLPALLLPSATPLAAAGLLLLGWSMLQSGARGRDGEDDSPAPSAFTLRTAAVALGSTATLAIAIWAAWPQPLLFDPGQRLSAAYSPAGSSTPLSLTFTRYDGPIHPVMPARSAVDTQPTTIRDFWFGTRLPDITDFRGVIRSQPLPVTARYLVVPFTGHPCTAGNGLRIRFVDAAGRESWESYVGADAGNGLDFWTVDATAHHGAHAEIFLFDGNAGERGWLGVAPPALTDDAAFAARWRARLRGERAEPTHLVIAAVAIFATVAALICLPLVAPPPRRLSVHS